MKELVYDDDRDRFLVLDLEKFIFFKINEISCDTCPDSLPIGRNKNKNQIRFLAAGHRTNRDQTREAHLRLPRFDVLVTGDGVP